MAMRRNLFHKNLWERTIKQFPTEFVDYLRITLSKICLLGKINNEEYNRYRFANVKIIDLASWNARVRIWSGSTYLVTIHRNIPAIIPTICRMLIQNSIKHPNQICTGYLSNSIKEIFSTGEVFVKYNYSCKSWIHH